MSTQLPFLNIEEQAKSLEILQETLNKYCKEGVFSMDEVFLNKTALNNLTNSVNALNLYQQYAVQQVKNQKELAKQAAKQADKDECECDDTDNQTVEELIEQSNDHSESSSVTV